MSDGRVCPVALECAVGVSGEGEAVVCDVGCEQVVYVAAELAGCECGLSEVEDVFAAWVCVALCDVARFVVEVGYVCGLECCYVVGMGASGEE